MKRSYGDESHDEHPAKVRRLSRPDRISRLSDELLVRILSFVPVPSLVVCQRISKKFSRLSTDSELWKAAYYRTFVLPRASRIPGIRDPATPNRLHYSSRLSRWLDDSYLIRDGVCTHWKQQYRLRHNWAQGQCAVSEILVAERPPEPPLLVMMSNNVVYAADSISGLRAWSSKSDRELLASVSLTSDAGIPRLPISMAIDASERNGGAERVVLGFGDGSFSLFCLSREEKRLDNLYTHPASTNGMLSAIAFASPYLLTMTEDHLLSLYVFPETSDVSGPLDDPQLLYSLRSSTAWPPVSLSLRTTASSMTAAIAYSLPTYLSGWTVGVQELRLSHEGALLESRLATAADEHSFTLSAYRSSSPCTHSTSRFPGSSARENALTSGPSKSNPTSMSYSHPYLLVAHPDNTLSLYLVRSTSAALSISSGNRLWGHTSSISGAHVGMRGKAVSVSRLGDELRVWDLEGGMASSALRKRSRNGELSVRIQPSRVVDEDEEAQDEDPTGRRHGLRVALDQGFDDSTVSRGWVGFDEQNVIVLREKSEGSQALVVYDFS